MNSKEVIEAAINLISDEKKWTQNAFARNSKGEILENSNDPEAVCWCAVGAIKKCSVNDKQFTSIIFYLDDYIYNDYNDSCASINDNLGREAVIDVLKEYVKTLNS